MLNRWVLSLDRKTATEGAEVTRSGRLFQTRAAATGKARSPTVDSRVRLTINDDDELERSRWAWWLWCMFWSVLRICRIWRWKFRYIKGLNIEYKCGNLLKEGKMYMIITLDLRNVWSTLSTQLTQQNAHQAVVTWETKMMHKCFILHDTAVIVADGSNTFTAHSIACYKAYITHSAVIATFSMPVCPSVRHTL